MTDEERSRRDTSSLRARARQLAERLLGVRGRLPMSVVDRASDLSVRVDALLRIDPRAFYVEGWSYSNRGELTEVVVAAPEGPSVDLVQRLFRYPRPDVAEFYGLQGSSVRFGFISYFELPASSQAVDGWVLHVRDPAGAQVQVAMPPVTTDQRVVREALIGDLALEPLPDETLRSGHLLPALRRMQERLASEVHIETVDQLGEAPASPAVSIVVPLYKKIEFLEQQLAQFVLDRELVETDLVYVLDSPEDAPYLRAFAVHLHRLYRVPFRLATLNRNGGYAIANNLGASLARAPYLLLLNSDIIPDQPGWLGRLVRFLERTPRAGVVSPKLLYEDGSLQFAGLYFDRPDGAHLWSNEHFYKGLWGGLPAANVPRSVPAVTGACLLISTERFREFGGLRGLYVQGDYEDSDLCLRLAEAGYESWYCPEVALYHLEGQSYPSELRRNASEYNKWLHTHLWRERLQAAGSSAASCSNP